MNLLRVFPAYRKIQSKLDDQLKINDELEKKLNNILNPPRVDKIGNVHSAEFKDEVEKSFISNGIQYYSFKKDSHMPQGRYMFVETFIKQYDLRMTKSQLQAFIDHMKSFIDKGNFTKVVETLISMETRLSMTFEIETTYDFASVIYFDENENLYTYDATYNKAKKARWREDNVVTFFYSKPMSDLLGLKDLSEEDLKGYIEAQKEILKSMTSET